MPVPAAAEYVPDAEAVATIELKADGGRTRLKLTEQGAYLDGFDNGAQREEGTRGLLDALGELLKQPAKR